MPQYYWSLAENLQWYLVMPVVVSWHSTDIPPWCFTISYLLHLLMVSLTNNSVRARTISNHPSKIALFNNVSWIKIKRLPKTSANLYIKYTFKNFNDIDRSWQIFPVKDQIMFRLCSATTTPLCCFSLKAATNDVWVLCSSKRLFIQSGGRLAVAHRPCSVTPNIDEVFQCPSSRYNIGYSLHSYFEKISYKSPRLQKKKYNADLISAVAITITSKFKQCKLKMTLRNVYSLYWPTQTYLVFFFGFLFSKKFKNFIS